MIKFEEISIINSEKKLCDPSILRVILECLSKINKIHTLYDVKVETKNEELSPLRKVFMLINQLIINYISYFICYIFSIFRGVYLYV